MLIVVGSIYTKNSFETEKIPESGENINALSAEVSPAGKGICQSLAAARMEVRVALVGRTGGDAYSQYYVTRIRRQGVMTSGIVESDLPTGSLIVINDQRGNIAQINHQGANAEVSADQVPEEILGPGNFVLLQTELPHETNGEIITKAKEGGASVILNLSPEVPVPEGFFTDIDYLILDRQSDIAALAGEIAKRENLCCIILEDSGSASMMMPDGSKYQVKVPETEDSENNRQSRFAEDCFCGFLAACLHEEYSPEDALRMALAASYLCEGNDLFTCFPYRDRVEELCAELPNVRR